MLSAWPLQTSRAPLDICLRATSGLKIDLSDILRLGELWDSSTMVQVYHSLIEPTDDANAGKLIGNRYFYSNDYMVSRVSIGQSIRSDAFLGPTRARLCLHVENVFDTDEEYRMHQLAKRSFLNPVDGSSI